MKISVCLSVTSDIVHDQRVRKVAKSLNDQGYSVTIIGRQRTGNEIYSDQYYIAIPLKLSFNSGFLFYFWFNLRLLIKLLTVKTDLFISNDLDTLCANYIASKIRNIPLIYDSHEYFTEVPELEGRIRVKRFWERIESYILPKLTYAYTVCESLSQIYFQKYGIQMEVIRNMPLQSVDDIRMEKGELPSTKSQFQIIYQGALNVGRGVDIAIRAMHLIPNSTFVIAGSGDITEELKKLVSDEKLDDKVIFTGLLTYNELITYTKNSDIGLSIEQHMGLNYYYALPNKIFDYLHSGVPVITSDFPEMKRIVNQYKIGITLSEITPETLADSINKLISNPAQLKKFKENCLEARKTLNWETDEKKLLNLVERALRNSF